MPIKSLEPYLFDLKTVTNCHLDVLKNATIGIDVEHYITRLFTPRKEPNLEAIGGFPLTLKQLAEADFKVFNELNIKPVFIFPGLKTVIQYNYLEQSDLLPFERSFKKIWDEKTTKDYHVVEAFRDANTPLSLRPIMNQFMEFLESRNVDFLVSPYSSWVQLQYLYKEGVIDTIFGSTDGLLLDSVDKFIISIEFESRQFKYIDRANVLNKLNLTSKQFKDIAMCIGNGFQPFNLNIQPHIPSQATFPSLHEFVLSGGSVYNTLLSLTDNKTMDIFQKGCASVEFMPVLKMSGRVEPLQLDNESSFLSTSAPIGSAGSSASTPSTSGTSDDNNNNNKLEQSKKVPNDLHEFIGQRLPDELFFYQSVGITTLELCETLIHGNQVERLPIDMTVTPLYQKLVTSDESLELTGKTLNLLTNCLNRYYQFKKLKLTTYFSGATEYELVQRVTPPLYLQLKPLAIRHTTARSFDLTTLLSSLSNEFLEDSIVTKEKLSQSTDRDEFKLSTNYELIATSLVRSLVVNNFIDSSNFKLTKHGELLQYVSKSSSVELLLLLLIFFKTFPSISTTDLLNPSDIKTINKQYKNQAILISKFLSLVAIKNFYATNYVNKVSRPLLQFRTVLARLSKTSNDLINANIITLSLLNQDDLDKYQRDNTDWKRLAIEIPFRNSLPNVLLGIMAQHFFEIYLLDMDISRGLSFVNATFKSVCERPSVELVRGLKIFKEVAGLVERLNHAGLLTGGNSDELVELFKSSTELACKILDSM